MQNNTPLPKSRFIKFAVLLMVLVLLVNPSVVRADIFGGGNNASGGIFGRIGAGLEGIFSGFRGVLPSGVIIPVATPTPTPLPGAVEVPENLPPAPNSAKQVKLTLEWDALSIGGESVYPQVIDPLADVHEPFVACPDCGGGSAYSPAQVVDPMVLSASSSRSTIQSGGVPAEPAPPAEPDPGGPGPPPPPPFIWRVCVPQPPCKKVNVEHVLVGWCGQDPNLLNASRVPGISVNSPGPNMFALPNAVSNKYIRRDGYAFSCVRECDGADCSTENYMEFQSEVYPSNAVSLYVKAENPSVQQLDNIIVTLNTLSYSPSGEYPLVQNIDFPYIISGTAIAYSHGSTLATKGYSTTVNGVMMQVEQRPGFTSPQIVIGPFSLGPAGTAESIKEFPLQPVASEFTRVPHSADTLAGAAIGTVKPAAPCECNGVRIHGVDGALGCGQDTPNPSNYLCQLYYGIGALDAGGKVCDQGCVPVQGCAPPWCFAGAQCSNGPMNQCPDVDNDGKGDKVTCDASGCRKVASADSPYAVNTQSLFSRVFALAQSKINELVPILQDQMQPAPAYALGCSQPCQNDPPPSVAGVGGMVPRDYNFICDPNDPEEASRCNGTDTQVLVPPTHPLFGTYRDVTGIGGCGYNASSNNSVLGPYEIAAEYGGTGDSRTSRSVILASIPVGGRLIDDQGRPYGWPMTGEITQNWGYTGQANAQGYYRSDPALEYGEYRYCSAAGGGNPAPNPPAGQPTATPTPGGPPPTINCDANAPAPDPVKNNVKPINDLIAALRTDYFYSVSSESNIRSCYNDVINRAIDSGNDPAMMMSIWIEESGASNYASFPGVADFGCASGSWERMNFGRQATCFASLQNAYNVGSYHAACRNSRPPLGALTVSKFLQLFSGGSDACVNNTYDPNPQFHGQAQRVYTLVSQGNKALNDDRVLPSTRWD